MKIDFANRKMVEQHRLIALAIENGREFLDLNNARYPLHIIYIEFIFLRNLFRISGKKKLVKKLISIRKIEKEVDFIFGSPKTTENGTFRQFF